jgi:transcriptional regulator with XRE-family HTH domain
VSALSDRIAAANRDNLSSRGISSRAAEFGIRVAHGTFANILNGTHGTPEDKTLRALSKVFQIPFGELRRLSGLTPTEEPWTPPGVAARLSPKQRKIVESLINELVRPEPPQG